MQTTNHNGIFASSITSTTADITIARLRVVASDKDIARDICKAALAVVVHDDDSRSKDEVLGDFAWDVKNSPLHQTGAPLHVVAAAIALQEVARLGETVTPINGAGEGMETPSAITDCRQGEDRASEILDRFAA